MPIFTPIPEAQVATAIRHLAALIGADAWQAGALVGIGRGGLAPAVYLSHATGLPLHSLDHSTAGADAGARIAALALLSQTTPLLFVDDINDTGRTIADLRARLDAAGAPAGQIRFATLIDNCRSAARVDYAARQIDRAATKDWFVFPWEAVASAAALAADAAAVPERTA